MIQIDDIHIEEFRGIRELKLDFGCKSFVIWGPNGSGKSGVIDALEFALTGSISRLSGAGLGSVTLLKHGPHVLRNADPSAARVSINVYDTDSKKKARLTRCIKSAKKFELSPDHEEVRMAIEKVQQHSEITLSRREIIRYIITEPGKRSQDVQILLKLGRLSEIRSVLRTVQTQSSSAVKSAQEQVCRCENQIIGHLGVASLQESEILEPINKQRTVLNLAPLGELRVTTILSEGADGPSDDIVFNKTAAIRQIEQLLNLITTPTAVIQAAEFLELSLQSLEEDPSIFETLRHRTLTSAGLELVTAASCPLCDVEWDTPEALRAHLTEKIQRSDEAAAICAELQLRAQALITASKEIRLQVTALSGTISTYGLESLVAALQRWTENLIAFEARLETAEGIQGQQARITEDPMDLEESIPGYLAELLSTVRGVPDQSAAANARSFLAIADQYWRDANLARRYLSQKVAARQAALEIYETYCTTCDAELSALYEDVEKEFSEYYREINADDEQSFKASLTSSAGRLDLSVDFHDTGMVPPGAYHSEGHQDGMGVCLYLALVSRLLGDEFRFAALDDVLMSIDSAHRRRFCALLADKFPNVQFIITTHDEVWANQMVKSGLVDRRAQARFHSWTVNDGPVYEQAVDIWDRISRDLVSDDISAAAARLRRYVEMALSGLAGDLRGSVAYRPDNNYDLGDFLSAVNGAHKKWLGQAMRSAEKWKNEDQRAKVGELQTSRGSVQIELDQEKWAVNPAVHFNEWADFARADFEPVVTAWQKFLNQFVCPNSGCGSIYISRGSIQEEAFRCKCGKTNLNLIVK